MNSRERGERALAARRGRRESKVGYRPCGAKKAHGKKPTPGKIRRRDDSSSPIAARAGTTRGKTHRDRAASRG